MVRFIYILLFTLLTTSSNSQQVYNRHWGTLYPIKAIPYYKPIYNDTARYRNEELLYAVNKSTNKIYIAEPLNAYPKISPNKITLYEFNENNNHIRYVVTDLISISKIIFSKTNEMFVNGQSAQGQLGLFKCDINGNLTFITTIGGSNLKSSVTFDDLGNIYVLRSASKTTVLSPCFFQNTGDQNSIINLQDVISKYDSKGKHIWSTFYFNNQSHIWGIVAGTNGLYIYGHEFLTTANSSYFGTPDSYQPKASGIYSNGNPSNAKNAFLTKFSFDGRRLWSTYYGPQQSNVPLQNIVMANKNMEVVGDDVYIITDHILTQGINHKLNTPNVAINSTPDFTNAKTLTKFSGDGKRLWTNYLYDAETLNITSDNNVMLSGRNNLLINLPNATLDAYQSVVKGTEDNITYTITSDGSLLKYLSYYGDIFRDNGIAVPTKNGYYVIGGSVDSPSKSSNLHTKDALFTKLEKVDTRYSSNRFVGNFVAFFTNKSLDITDKNSVSDVKFTIYPNPSSDVVYIETETALSTNSLIIIYDINGRKVFHQKVLDQFKNSISISQLPTSVYLLEIQTENQKYQTKIIKN